MSSARHPHVANLALVVEQRHLVRNLSGFRKSHRVPDEINDRTQRFVEQIALADISSDLDIRFSEFRKHFPFKRIDLRVTEPEDGNGIIATPWFEYRVTVRQAEDDAGEAVLRRQVTDFKSPDAIVSSEFAAAFGNIFNTVEFEPIEPIDIEAFIDHLESRDDLEVELDYDRTSTWCQLLKREVPGQLLVQSDCVSLITSQADLPAKLLEAFLRYRSCLDGIECFRQ